MILNDCFIKLQVQRKLLTYRQVNEKMKKDNEDYENLVAEINNERADMMKIIGKQGEELNRYMLVKLKTIRQ